MEIIDFLKLKKILYKEQVSLSSFTGMNIVGCLPIVAYPDSLEKLSDLYRFLLSSSYTYEIVGGMSNTYFCSGLRRDIIVKTIKCTFLEKKQNSIKVGCGYSLTKFSREMASSGIFGYEGLVGIPGTVGAAAINNSGAFGYEMSQVIKEIEIINTEGHNKIYSLEDIMYQSRDSCLKGKNFGIITTVTFDISKKMSPEILLKRVNKFATIRKEKIDGKRKSLGSTIAAKSLYTLWDHHQLAFYLKKILYLPFKFTRWSKKVKCWLDFLVLGFPHLAKHCDSIGRFCWSKDTEEKSFFEYIDAMRKISHNRVKFEIEIKE